MAFKAPSGTCEIEIKGLGKVKGFIYENGVRQFTGIPYATLSKRWTRSQLNTSWQDNYHDGTKLGCSAPNPPEYNVGEDFLTPVPPVPHFNHPEEDELNCLVMNITLPPESLKVNHPVMLYIHGGSFLFGGANRAIFDGVNFVSYSVDRATPVVAVNFNYRVGLGGFLASTSIKEDLAKDGFDGVGNFGLTDQQVAMEWVQKYISDLGGDKENVTIYGESAGGMSVSHQIAAKNPGAFHRGIAMSGQLNTIPTWSLEHHEKHYRALLQYLKIDPDSPDGLEQLRNTPQADVAAATLHVEGTFGATGNPCDDGVFHMSPPQFSTFEGPPTWLKGYMVGDTYDEAMIFRETFMESDYNFVRGRLIKFLGENVTDKILDLYGVKSDLSPEEWIVRMEDMAGDTTFKVHNWIAAHESKVPQTYAYHVDQQSTLDNPLKGLAYHAIDLGYVFQNLRDRMTPEQCALADKMAGDWIDFAHGKDPWPRFSHGQQWMVYGPNDGWAVKTEIEDEPKRRYNRTKEVLKMGIYQDFMLAIDDIATNRYRMGTFEWAPPKMT